MTDNAGIRAVASLLAKLSDPIPFTASSFAREIGIARSTAFDVIQQLEKAGLVVRDRQGRVSGARKAVALAFARHGLSLLPGPAEGVLAWLRSEGARRVELASGDTLLLSMGRESSGRRLTRLIHHRMTVRLSIEYCADTGESDLAYLAACLEKAARTLEAVLDGSYGAEERRGPRRGSSRCGSSQHFSREPAMKANYGLSAQEVTQGYVLTCQAVPLTDDVVLDYDA